MKPKGWYDPQDHYHFIEAKDGDLVCMDIVRLDGWVYALDWYSGRMSGGGNKEFGIKEPNVNQC